MKSLIIAFMFVVLAAFAFVFHQVSIQKYITKIATLQNNIEAKDAIIAEKNMTIDTKNKEKDSLRLSLHNCVSTK